VQQFETAVGDAREIVVAGYAAVEAESKK
jgi:hypothetical protein